MSAIREELPPITRELSAIGRALKLRHPDAYEENECGFAWWAWDSQNVLDHLAAGTDEREAIRESLLDSGVHEETETQCLALDVEAILEATAPTSPSYREAE